LSVNEWLVVEQVDNQIGLMMLIGLAAKNAILIAEFAKLKREEGKSLESVVNFSTVFELQSVKLTAPDYLFVESAGISEPLPGADPRLGRRTILSFPLLPPPQKN
jgi:hypothetical protein